MSGAHFLQQFGEHYDQVTSLPRNFEPYDIMLLPMLPVVSGPFNEYKYKYI